MFEQRQKNAAGLWAWPHMICLHRLADNCRSTWGSSRLSVPKAEERCLVPGSVMCTWAPQLGLISPRPCGAAGGLRGYGEGDHAEEETRGPSRCDGGEAGHVLTHAHSHPPARGVCMPVAKLARDSTAQSARRCNAFSPVLR